MDTSGCGLPVPAAAAAIVGQIAEKRKEGGVKRSTTTLKKLEQWQTAATKTSHKVNSNFVQRH